MKNARAIVLGGDVLPGNTGVVARHAVYVERHSLGRLDDDRLRNRVRDRSQLFLRALQVVDVRAGAVPSDDVAALVAQRLDPDQEPPIRSVVAS
jgi:hypothetical protein